MTARVYPAETMREWGVVNRVLPAAELLQKARSFTRRLAAGPTLAHAATKRIIRLTDDAGIAAADAALPDVGAKVMASQDLQNGARTLLEKGPGHATFASLQVLFSRPTTDRALLTVSLALIDSLTPMPLGDSASPPEVTRCSSLPCRPQTPWCGG